MEKNELSKRLKKAREDLGLSQSQLSIRSGIDVNTIRAWEQERSSINENVLRNAGGLIKALGSNADFVLEAMGLTPQDVVVFAEDISGKPLKRLSKPRAQEGTVGKTLEALGGRHNVVTPSTRRRLIESQIKQVTKSLEEIYEIGVVGLADTSGLLESIASQLQAEAFRLLEASEKRDAKLTTAARASSSRPAKADRIASAPKHDS